MPWNGMEPAARFPISQWDLEMHLELEAELGSSSIRRP